MYLRKMRDRYVESHSGPDHDEDGEMKKNRLLSDDSADDGAFSLEDEEGEQHSWTENNRISRISACGSEEDTTGFNDCDPEENVPFSQ